jgi:hypothetical protein
MHLSMKDDDKARAKAKAEPTRLALGGIDGVRFCWNEGQRALEACRKGQDAKVRMLLIRCDYSKEGR